ncbi:MAG: MYXO-CTERM domain-containing protein [Polyangiales bacterium]|jgi:MYXO-CTERM domain-containing protein
MEVLMRSRLLALVLGSLTFSCAVDGPQFGSQESSIIDGVREEGYPEVMFLFNLATRGACTATLISPRVVLTAKHCVQNGNAAQAAAANNFRLFVGSNGRRPSAQYNVSEVLTVPGSWDIGRGDASDVALLILPANAAETPRPVEFGSASGLTTFTAIGYGQTPEGTSGIKMRVQGTVERTGGGLIFVAPSVCQGDSGGPIIGDDGSIYGVVSYGYARSQADFDALQSGRCGPPAVYNGIAQFQEFIEDAIESTGGCSPTEEVCNGADDNCDGTVDEGCSAFGVACTDSSECSSGLCDETEVGVACTQACDPLRADLGCPPGFFCQNAGGCDGLCAPRTDEELALGDECSASGECASGHCAAIGEATQRCHFPCRDSTNGCFAGEVCFANDNSCGACVAARFVAPPRDQGEPCEADEDCGTGTCMNDNGVRFCSDACAMPDDCDEGFHCRAEQCIPGIAEGAGGGCLENQDCAGGFCATQGERAWCSAFCTSIEDCPLGFSCTDAGDQNICTPANGLVGDSCEVNEGCISGLCVNNTSRGSVCSRFCDADTACSAGFQCNRVDTSAICLRPESGDEEPPTTVPFEEDSGGCSASPGASGGAWSLLGLAGLAILRRRRRSRV